MQFYDIHDRESRLDLRHHIQSPQGTIGILYGICVTCGSSEERPAGNPFVAELRVLFFIVWEMPCAMTVSSPVNDTFQK
jgi:hypothetical protein